MKFFRERGINGKIEIETLGASGGIITGSCHRLNIRNSSVSIDYGLFQGKIDERSARGERRNFTPTNDIAKGLTDILITHPHIDHTGRLPKVFRDGFTPTILATEITSRFMEPLLINSAEIQSKENPMNCLYDKKDVDKALRYLKIVDPFREVAIGQNHSKITAEFLPNGHVMGANSVLIRSRENNLKHNILFTGDMGKPNQSLCGGYLEQVANYPNDSINTLVVESTNFLNNPVSFEEKRRNLFNEINKVWRDGGTPLLPVLSFHRFEEILEMLHNSQGSLIPKDCKIIIDAPLGVTLLESFKALNPNEYSNRYGEDKDFYKTIEESIDRFNLNNVEIIGEHKQSLLIDKKMADFKGKAIIIASGGMGEHGRIVNYLHGDFGKNPKNEIVFTCFQVEGTKGASLVRNENILSGNGTGARVKKIEGFTSHISGPNETFDFLERFNLQKLGTVIITHGKDTARVAMANEFRERGYKAKIFIPKLNQTIVI